MVAKERPGESGGIPVTERSELEVRAELGFRSLSQTTHLHELRR